MIKKKSLLMISSAALIGFICTVPAPSMSAEWQKIVDYGDPGYSETSNNWVSRAYGDSYGGSYRYLSREVGDHSRRGTATWQTKVPYCGKYRVTVTCRKTENRTPDADYYVTNSEGGFDHYEINQVHHSNIQVSDVLGEYVYEKDQSVIVRLDGDDGWSDCADATIWELVERTRCSGEAYVAPTNMLLLDSDRR